MRTTGAADRHALAFIDACACALALAAVVSLVSCAPIAETRPNANRAPLVYPPPPDAARFVYERTIYSSADVVPQESGSGFRRMVTGESITGEGIGKPYAVAVAQGRIFVTDTAERVVKVFDAANGRFYRIGEAEPGQLAKPLGIDVDRKGRVFVADATAKVIQVYDSGGKHLRRIGGPEFFQRLSSVTVDPNASRIYVVDIGGVQSELHRVRVFDTESGAHLFDFGARGTGPGQFNLPRDLAVGKDGRLYVVDGGNFRVSVFDHDGKYLESFGSVGTQIGSFARPKEIAADAEGNMYVVDAAFGNFQIFNERGELLMFIGNRSENDGPGKYMLPSGIAIDEDGRVYMVDQWFRKIDVFRPVSLSADAGSLRRPSGSSGPASKQADAKQANTKQ
ncbi:MAG TPA: 6-bladed beta-propeller [Burkholderiales bacterium]|nr:6-bladed beta-propeller [Burkholderiales bacterium]